MRSLSPSPRPRRDGGTPAVATGKEEAGTPPLRAAATAAAAAPRRHPPPKRGANQTPGDRDTNPLFVTSSIVHVSGASPEARRPAVAVRTACHVQRDCPRHGCQTPIFPKLAMDGKPVAKKATTTARGRCRSSPMSFASTPTRPGARPQRNSNRRGHTRATVESTKSEVRRADRFSVAQLTPQLGIGKWPQVWPPH